MRKRHLEILGYHVLQVSKEKIVPVTKEETDWLMNCCPNTDSSLWMEFYGAFNTWCLEGISEKEVIRRTFLMIPKMHFCLDVHPGMFMRENVAIDGLHIMCKCPILLLILTRTQRNTTVPLVPLVRCFFYIWIFCNINIIAVINYQMSNAIKSHYVLWVNTLNVHVFLSSNIKKSVVYKNIFNILVKSFNTLKQLSISCSCTTKLYHSLTGIIKLG